METPLCYLLKLRLSLTHKALWGAQILGLILGKVLNGILRIKRYNNITYLIIIFNNNNIIRSHRLQVQY